MENLFFFSQEHLLKPDRQECLSYLKCLIKVASAM